MSNFFKNIKFSTKEICLVILFSVSFFLLAFFNFRSYQSQVLILIIPKSAVTASQQTQILNNLIELPRTLAFYDRLLANNPNFLDSTIGQAPEKRKKLWNQMLVTKQVGNQASMFSISIFGDDQKTTEMVASKTATTFFETTNRYYNVKTELDTRMVEGPITQTVFTNWLSTAVLSILAGILLVLILQPLQALRQQRFDLQNIFTKNLLPNLNFAKKNAVPMSLEDLYAAEENQAQTLFEQQAVTAENIPEEVAVLQEIADRGVYPNFPEMPVHHKEDGGVPSNLPIADAEDSFVLQANEQSAGLPMIEEAVPQEKTHEPTPAELKERLNQLLKGDF